MARRRRNDDWIWPVAQLVGLLMGLSLIYPPFRQVVVGIGSIVLSVVVIAVVLIFGVGIYKLASRRSARGQFTLESETPAALQVPRIGPTVSPVPTRKPETTEHLVNQLRSIDWF